MPAPRLNFFKVWTSNILMRDRRLRRSPLTRDGDSQSIAIILAQSALLRVYSQTLCKNTVDLVPPVIGQITLASAMIKIDWGMCHKPLMISQLASLTRLARCASEDSTEIARMLWLLPTRYCL